MPRKTDVVAESKRIQRPARRADSTRPGSWTPHVLVADSDEMSRVKRQAFLADAGCRVTVAHTGFEAIIKAASELPDLILLDEGLFDLDTHDTWRLLTGSPVTAHIPVVRVLPGHRVPMRAIASLRRVTV